MSEEAPAYAPFFTFAGASLAVIFSSLGTAYGTALSGTRFVGLGILKEKDILKCLVAVVIAGILSIYGLIISILITASSSPDKHVTLRSSLMNLAAGCCTGLTGIAAGYSIGYVSDKSIRAYYKETRLYAPMVVILVFCEILAIYGFIAGIVLYSS